MKSKKGFTEAQFHWIFILIAGTIILSFFISIVLKQRQLSESKVALSVVQDLETITTGAEISKGTAQILDKPDLDLKLSCDYCECKYDLQGNERNFGDKIIFSTSIIKGKEIISWTKDWNAPFRITNFLFLTSPTTRYYIIYDEADSASVALMQYVKKSLPSKINAEFLKATDFPTQFENLNYPEIKLVYLNKPLTSTDGTHFNNLEIQDKFITATEITSSRPFEYGTVSFWKKKGSNFKRDKGADGKGLDSIEFIGDESIFAAIFSHDYDMYACNMQKAYDKMKLICTIYENRTKVLYSSECTNIYDNAKKVMETLISKSGQLSNNLAWGFSNYTTVTDYLEGYNQQLVINGCTTIY